MTEALRPAAPTADAPVGADAASRYAEPRRSLPPDAWRTGGAVLSGVLLALARPTLDLWPLALVALVPLLAVWRTATPRAAAGYGLLAGVVYHGILVSWSWYFGAIAIVPFVTVLGAYWAATGYVVGRLDRLGLRSPFLTAAVWVLAEALVSRWPLGGFSWGEVGYALVDLSTARALASWGGVPLVSFAVVAAGGLLVDLAQALRSPRAARRPGAARRAALALVAVVGVSVLGQVLRVDTTPTGPLRYALLQGNDINRELTDAELDARTLPVQHFELADDLDGPQDLVVFPESSMDEDPRSDPWLEDQLVAVAERLDAHVLTNAVADAPDGRAVNLNLLYGPDGELQGTYAKRHLVPFGEWVPMRSVLEGWIGALEEVPRDFRPGDSAEVFDVAGHRVATIICFETAFGPQVRDLAASGAEVVVVSTNNRSYRRSANAAQHLELSRMRAAETGRPVLHASINGITGVIDADGDVLARTELFVNSVTIGTIDGTTGATPYVRLGEWVVVGCLLAVVTAATVGIVRRRRRPVDSAERSPATDPSAESTTSSP